MIKNRTGKWLLIGALVAAVVALSVVSVGVVSVAAQELEPGDGSILGRFGQRMRGVMGRFGGRADSLLADELGITSEELAAAREAAHEAAIAQAVAEGDLTQEEADALLARHALRSYLDPRALMAEALGVTEEQLAEKPMHEWLEEQGLDINTFHEQMQAAHADALAQAVTDGVITQEQADAILANEAGFGPGGGFRGSPRGGFRGTPRGRGQGGCPGMDGGRLWQQSQRGPDA